jgi:hypothetical protein
MGDLLGTGAKLGATQLQPAADHDPEHRAARSGIFTAFESLAHDGCPPTSLHETDKLQAAIAPWRQHFRLSRLLW